MTRALRPALTFAVLLALWEALARAGVAPPFLLPAPSAVAARAVDNWALLAGHALSTAWVALLGLALGSAFGALNAITLAQSPAARRWVLPLLISGQAVPIFALAPLLTLWFGFGPTAKIIMTVLVVYFPVTAAFYDGLARVDPRLLELAQVMNGRPSATLWRVRIPAALPALGSGLKLAAVFAPISAVIGEWTGGANGLGYLMLYANSRMQPDLLFAAILLLAVFGVSLHALVAALVRRAAPWAPETLS